MSDKNMEAEIFVQFTEATSRQSLNTGESITTLWGKAKKWLSDLKSVAFSGSFNDLSDVPTSFPANGGNAMSANHQIQHYFPDGTKDVLEYACSDYCPSNANTKIRITNCPTCPTNYGYNGADNDFWYDIYKLDSKYITIKAYDIRTNSEFTKSCIAGNWTDWMKCSDYGNADTLDGFHETSFSRNRDNISDCNDAVLPGTYNATPETGNTPYSEYWLISVETGSNGTWIRQTATRCNSTIPNETYHRIFINDKWSDSWTKINDGGHAAVADFLTTLNEDGTSFGSLWQMKAQFNRTGDTTFRIYCGDGGVWTSVNRADEATYANSSGITGTADAFCLRNLASGSVPAKNVSNFPQGAWYGQYEEV